MSGQRPHRVLMGAVFCSLVLIFSAIPAYAAALTVDAGTPYAAADGRCSLVEAIENANADAAIHADCPAGAGADVITLTRNVTLNGTTTFTADNENGLPSITSDITIEGDGRTIQRANTTTNFRILHVAVGGNLSLNDVTIQGGNLDGFAIDGGGILNRGTLTISNSTLRNNSITGVFTSGGGLYNVGQATVINSTISNNAAPDGGGIYQEFGAGTLTLIGSTISNNQAENDGGGLGNFGPTELYNTTFSGNSAGTNGGAILSDGTGTLAMYNSTFSNNSSGILGGAISNEANNVFIYSTLFQNNTAGTDPAAPFHAGGALYNILNTVNIVNSQFIGNRAIDGLGGAIVNAQSGIINLDASIVRGNTAAQGGGLYTQLAPININDSTIEGNVANEGGGLFQESSNLPGFIVNRSAIINNRANIFGGGFAGYSTLSTSTFVNTTFSGNVAPRGAGVLLNGGGMMDLSFSTITDNTSTQSSTSIGGLDAFTGVMTIGSTIVADNQNADCSATGASTSADNNLTTGPGGTQWCSFIAIQPNDLTATSPLLTGLANNGGATLTHAPQAGSPVLNGIPTDCPGGLNVDQRGMPRLPGSCDIGAYSDDFIPAEVYFQTPGTTVDNEGTVGLTSVGIVLDNTNGTIPAGVGEITIYLRVTGTATPGSDYTAPITVPITIGAGGWPAPGGTTTVFVDFTILDDLIYEGNENIILEMSVVGPAIPGLTQHTITIIDDETPPPVSAVNTTDTVGDEVADAAPQIDIFDPAISKLGFLRPGELGVLGERIEWRITVTNTGTVPGSNVVVSDTLRPELQIDDVTTSLGSSTINGQTVTISIPSLAPGQSANISIFTTVTGGSTIVSNTACVNGDNASAETCATALPVSSLPATGQTPFWRAPLIGVAIGVTLLVLWRKIAG